jgi:hypothetical protein
MSGVSKHHGPSTQFAAIGVAEMRGIHRQEVFYSPTRLKFDEKCYLVQTALSFQNRKIGHINDRQNFHFFSDTVSTLRADMKQILLEIELRKIFPLNIRRSKSKMTS